MKLNKYLLLFSISAIFCIFISFYALDKRFIGKDQESHFYDMKKYYENKEFPTMISIFISIYTYFSLNVLSGFYYIYIICFFI